MGDLTEYTKLEELGKGRTSIVYKATHPEFNDNKPLALKQLRPGVENDRLPNSSKTILDLLREEYFILNDFKRQFTDHNLPLNYVPQVFDHNLDESPYLALSLASGQAVDNLLNAHPDGLDEPVAIGIMLHFATVLEQLHDGLHRTYTDMQLGNLYWQPDPNPDELPGTGDLMVIDWNVVSAVSDDPESDNFRERVNRDVMLAGVFLLRLLTNRLASLQGISLLELQKLERWTDISRKTRDLVANLLCLDTEQRTYHTAAELKTTLEDIHNRWKYSPRKAKGEIEAREYKHEELKNLPESTDKELKLIEWALETDEWLPMLERLCDPENRPDINRLYQLVANHLSNDPVADIARGRIFFEGAGYEPAQAYFLRAEKAGLGLQALRWHWLTAFALSGDNAFVSQHQILYKALLSLDDQNWGADELQATDELSILHQYFAREARVRFHLSQNELEYALEAENFLCQLPNPEIGKEDEYVGDEYVKALRLEIGDLAEQVKESKQKASRTKKFADDWEKLEAAWEKFRSASDNHRETTLTNFLTVLEELLAAYRGDPDWLGWVLEKSRELVDVNDFEAAIKLLSLGQGYSCQVYQQSDEEALTTAIVNEYQLAHLLSEAHKWAEKDDAARQIFLDNLNSRQIVSLINKKDVWKSQFATVLESVWDTDTDNDRVLAALYQFNPEFDPAPIRNYKKDLQEAKEYLATQKPYTALTTLGSYAENPEIIPLREQAKQQIQKKKQNLSDSFTQGEYLPCLHALIDWTEAEPNQAILLQLCINYWQKFLQVGEFDLAKELQERTNAYKQGVPLLGESDAGQLDMLDAVTNKLKDWDDLHGSSRESLTARLDNLGLLLADLSDLTKLDTQPIQYNTPRLRTPIDVTTSTRRYIQKKLQQFVSNLLEENLLSQIGLGVTLAENGFSEPAQMLRDRQSQLLESLLKTDNSGSQITSESHSSAITYTLDKLWFDLEADPDLWLVGVHYLKIILGQPPNGIAEGGKGLERLSEIVPIAQPSEITSLNTIFETWLNPLHEIFLQVIENPEKLPDFTRKIQSTNYRQKPSNANRDLISRWLSYWLGSFARVSLLTSDVQNLQTALHNTPFGEVSSVKEQINSLLQKSKEEAGQQQDKDVYKQLEQKVQTQMLDDPLQFDGSYEKLQTEKYQEKAVLLLNEWFDNKLAPIKNIVSMDEGLRVLLVADIANIKREELQQIIDRLQALRTVIKADAVIGDILPHIAGDLNHILSKLYEEDIVQRWSNLRGIQSGKLESLLAEFSELPADFLELTKTYVREKLKQFVSSLSNPELLRFVGIGTALESNGFMDVATLLRDRQQEYLEDLWFKGELEARRQWQEFTQEVADSKDNQNELWAVIQLDPALWRIGLQHVVKCLMQPPDNINESKNGLVKISDLFEHKDQPIPAKVISLGRIIEEWLEPLHKANQQIVVDINNINKFINIIEERAGYYPSLGVQNQDIIVSWLTLWLDNLDEQPLVVDHVERLQRAIQSMGLLNNGFQSLINKLREQARYNQLLIDSQKWTIQQLDFDYQYNQLQVQKHKYGAIQLLHDFLLRELKPVDDVLQYREGKWSLLGDVTTGSERRVEETLSMLQNLSSILKPSKPIGQYLPAEAQSLLDITTELANKIELFRNKRVLGDEIAKSKKREECQRDFENLTNEFRTQINNAMTNKDRDAFKKVTAFFAEDIKTHPCAETNATLVQQLKNELHENISKLYPKSR